MGACPRGGRPRRTDRPGHPRRRPCPGGRGRLQIRHRLTRWLHEVGGHIGYDVRPTARNRGHATAMLHQAKPYAARLGINPALVTCDEDNPASRKVIERNGGILQDQRGIKLRYWVPTA